jgi:sugar transferase (PEP-CTERM/EpsH1 system associated)
VKILFLTPQPPYPPRKGTAMRNWGLISNLAERHEVAVLSFSPPSPAGGDRGGGDDPLTVTCRIETVEPPLRSLRTRLRAILTTPKPDMALRLVSGAYAERLRAWLKREPFDVVHVEGIEMAPYLDSLEAAQDRPLVVFDDHNCEYLLQKRAFLTDLRIPSRWAGAAYSFIQWQRLLDYEALACRRSSRVLAVSEADAAALRKLVPDANVIVVPNGIDTRLYRPEISKLQSPISRNSLVFTGTMDFRPNVDAVLWFAREVLPRVRTHIGDARFLVVGQRPHRRLDVLRDDPAVTLTGFVEDARPYIADAAVYVVPLRMGGGTRFKILEALAMGKGVVSTTLGAEGFPVTHGRELLLADTAEDLARAVVSLLNAPEKRASLGRAGRAFVEARYDWRVIVPLVEAAYESPNP